MYYGEVQYNHGHNPIVTFDNGAYSSMVELCIETIEREIPLMMESLRNSEDGHRDATEFCARLRKYQSGLDVAIGEKVVLHAANFLKALTYEVSLLDTVEAMPWLLMERLENPCIFTGVLNALDIVAEYTEEKYKCEGLAVPKMLNPYNHYVEACRIIIRRDGYEV